MHHFTYRDGVLAAEGVSLAKIAAEIGTPFYCYSTATLERHYRVFTEAFAGLDTLVAYAMKANSNQGVVKTLARLGAGVDVVSGGELRRAKAAGVPGDKIIFSGVGKTKAEMALGLDEDILCFNVESEPELEALAEVAKAKGRRARISAPRQSGRRCAHARENLDGKIREQVRHPAKLGARASTPRPPNAEACRSLAWTCTSARRSPILRPTTRLSR